MINLWFWDSNIKKHNNYLGETNIVYTLNSQSNTFCGCITFWIYSFILQILVKYFTALEQKDPVIDVSVINISKELKV